MHFLLSPSILIYRFMYSKKSLLSKCFQSVIDFLPSYHTFFFIHKLIVQIKTVSVDHSLIILSLFSLSPYVGALFYVQLSNNIDYLLFVYSSLEKK